MRPYTPPYVNDSRPNIDILRVVFEKYQIRFSKREAAKIVGGIYRLERLVEEGKVRMDKPAAKQNGKWFCNGWDVLTHTKI